jgi:hypothetical protein
MLQHFLPGYDVILIHNLPGFVRSATMLVWLLILLAPISNALDEVKTTQWEAVLAANIKTRSIMIGRFLGALPLQLILIFVATPIFVAPVITTFQVSFVGQLVVYSLILVTLISSIWLSTVISSGIQAKLSTSPHGDDIAKILGNAISLMLLIPMFAFMYFPESFTSLMDENAFLAFPFSWGGDLISWSVLTYRGVELSSEMIAQYMEVLILTAPVLICLFIGFTFSIVFFSIAVSDNIYLYGFGARTEKVISVGRENFVLRSIRRADRNGSTGVLIITVLKDFFRKARNTLSISMACIASILPLIIAQLIGAVLPDIPLFAIFLTMFLMAMVYPIVGGFVLGLAGIYESKEQLWTIRGAPNGGLKYVKAHLIAMLIPMLPLTLIPPFFVALMLGADALMSLAMPPYAFLLLLSSTMTGIGIGCLNPVYDDVSFVSFRKSGLVSLLVILLFIMVPAFTLLEYVGPIIGVHWAFGVLTTLPITIIGLILFRAGAWKMSRPER